MVAPATWTKLRTRSRANWHGRTGENYVIEYGAPVGQTLAAVHTAFPKWSHYGGTTGTFRPTLEDVDIEVEGALRGTRDLVRLHYLAPTWRGVLERNPNKARLLASINEVAVRPERDLDKEWVWHEEWEKIGLVYSPVRWRPVSGSGLQHHARTLLRLQVVGTQGVLGAILALHDTVNAGATSFGAPPGTLRMAGGNTETVMSEDSLTFLDAVMEYNKKGWNKDTEVQKFEYRVLKVPLYDYETGETITDRYREVGDWWPMTGKDATYTARLHKAASWAGLDKQIVWT